MLSPVGRVRLSSKIPPVSLQPDHAYEQPRDSWRLPPLRGWIVRCMHPLSGYVDRAQWHQIGLFRPQISTGSTSNCYVAPGDVVAESSIFVMEGTHSAKTLSVRYRTVAPTIVLVTPMVSEIGPMIAMPTGRNTSEPNQS